MGTLYKKGIPFGGGVSGSAENVAYDETTNVKEAIDGVKSDVAEVSEGLTATNESLDKLGGVIDTNSNNKVSFITAQGSEIGLPTGYYKVMTVSPENGQEGYQIAIGYYGGECVGKVHRRTFVNGAYEGWDGFALNSDLASEDVVITAIDSNVVTNVGNTTARKMEASKTFSFSTYFILSGNVINEGTPYVTGFARPIGSGLGIFPMFNCLYRNSGSGATRVGTCYINYNGQLVCGYRDHTGEVTGYDQVLVNGTYPYA